MQSKISETYYGSERRGVIYIILSAVLYGTMPLWTKIAYGFGSNTTMVVMGRFLTGALFCGVAVTLTPGISLRINRRQFFRLLILSFFYAAMAMLLYSSYTYIDSGLATALHFTYPIAVMLLMFVFFREKPGKRKVLATMLCLAGMALLYQPGGNLNAFGMVLAVASGVAFASFIVILGKSDMQALHTWVITFWVALFVTAEMGAVAFLRGSFHLTRHWQTWGAVGMLGFLATFLATAMFQRGVFLCGELRASLLSTLEPVTSTIIGILVFAEPVRFRGVTGLLCILLSAVLMSVSGNRRKQDRVI